jgi:heavy metal sensor kinase
LSPVDALTRTARTISGSNLSQRLEPLHTGDELQRLSDTLNEMLSRIEAAFLRVTQFTADASHELRTPISLIRTEAEIALRKSRSEEEYRDALFHVLTEAERTSSMVEKLLLVARSDSGQNAMEMRPVDLRDTARKVAGKWKAVVESKSLEFTEMITGRDLLVAGDQVALQQLLNILIDNAVKYTPAGGQIIVQARAQDGEAVLVVQDTGPGVPPDEQPRIWERLYRGDQSRSQSGLGLGLSLVRAIVEAHGGRAGVANAPGGGAIFELHLPLAPAPAPVPVG